QLQKQPAHVVSQAFRGSGVEDRARAPVDASVTLEEFGDEDCDGTEIPGIDERRHPLDERAFALQPTIPEEEAHRFRRLAPVTADRPDRRGLRGRAVLDTRHRVLEKGERARHVLELVLRRRVQIEMAFVVEAALREGIAGYGSSMMAALSAADRHPPRARDEVALAEILGIHPSALSEDWVIRGAAHRHAVRKPKPAHRTHPTGSHRAGPVWPVL